MDKLFGALAVQAISSLKKFTATGLVATRRDKVGRKSNSALIYG